jgi:diaminopimelate epimerase
MSAALKNNSSSLSFIKASALGNDFIIFDARENENFSLSKAQIQKFSNRKFIGCDQLIILKKGSNNFDAEMQIYNQDGSVSGACGNATRCVAKILIDDLQKEKLSIKTAAGILSCEKKDELIAVNMGKINFFENISLFGFNFYLADIGNPHAVAFLKEEISDEKFLEISPQIENHSHFKNKTNVEFARIINDELIEVRVFERGVGETLACGSGACCVGALAIKNSLINSKKVKIRFKGGDLEIAMLDGDEVLMVGGCGVDFYGRVVD